MLKIPGEAHWILETLESRGFSAWCVGGCVRDGLLDRTPEDWDVASSALPEELLDLFGGAAVPTGLRHGTVTVRAGSMAVEVTTYRADGPYLDHRRPASVAFSREIEQDLARRDFTVNAMALNLRGELRDPFGGRTDLAAGVLRCVGEPDRRFREDALRIMRCLRFASVLDFSVEAETEAALRRNRELLREIAAERIRGELDKLLRGPAAAAVLRRYPEVPGVFWPEILPMMGFDQRNRHHCYDVWEHTLHALDSAPADAAVRYAVLLHDIGKPECFTVDERGCGHFYGHPAHSRDLADRLLRRLRMDSAARERIVRLVEWHDRNIPRTEKGVRRALMALGEEELRLLLEVKRADNHGQAPEFWTTQAEIGKAERILGELLTQNACFSLRNLAVKGGDLMRLGISGPEVGRLLRLLLERVVDGELPNQRAALLEYARGAAAL